MARSLTHSRISAALTKSLFAIAVLMMVMTSLRSAHAQVYGSRSHTVTVTVNTINNLALSSGSVSLTITGADVVAGQDLMGPVVNTATNLLWGTNRSLRKVTVRTDLVAPLYSLTVLAVSPTAPGTAAPEVSLSTVDTDFLLNIGRSSGTATLQYTGTALASTGVGTDSHVVTFSIVAQ